jgi:hypothetical protein
MRNPHGYASPVGHGCLDGLRGADLGGTRGNARPVADPRPPRHGLRRCLEAWSAEVSPTVEAWESASSSYLARASRRPRHLADGRANRPVSAPPRVFGSRTGPPRERRAIHGVARAGRPRHRRAREGRLAGRWLGERCEALIGPARRLARQEDRPVIRKRDDDDVLGRLAHEHDLLPLLAGLTLQKSPPMTTA